MIAWANLWKAFALKPGTARPRLLLTAWEAILGLIVWSAGHWLPWWGLLVGFGAAFLAHELFFMVWALRVARVPEADVYREPGFTACLERWTGPVSGVSLCLALAASPAAAEFTDAEKANVHNLLLGVNLIRSGLQDQVAAQSWPGYYTAWQAAVDCHDALGYLFGTQIKQGEQARADLAALPRSGWLTLAWQSLDRCASELGAAQSLTGATTKYGQAQIVVAQFPRFDVAPLYQQPKPIAYPKVIGPHGDYDFSQEDLWFAIKYAHDALYVWGSRYLGDAANYEAIVMGALANVRFAGAETADGFDSTAVDAVDNVLWLQKFALQDTATKYLAATMNEFAQAAPANRGDALQAVVKANDSWKNLDRAMRNTVCFDGRIACDRTAH